MLQTVLALKASFLPVDGALNVWVNFPQIKFPILVIQPPKMRIYFVASEQSDDELFTEALRDHEVHFVSELKDVESDAEILSVFLESIIDNRFLNQHQAIKLIVTRSTGHDHIDISACENTLHCRLFCSKLWRRHCGAAHFRVDSSPIQQMPARRPDHQHCTGPLDRHGCPNRGARSREPGWM
jgi:hypothetical protein